MSGSRLAFAIFIELAVLAGMPKPAMPRNRQNHNQSNGLSEYIERVSARLRPWPHPQQVEASGTTRDLLGEHGRGLQGIARWRLGDDQRCAEPLRFEYWECFYQPKLYCEFGDHSAPWPAQNHRRS